MARLRFPFLLEAVLIPCLLLGAWGIHRSSVWLETRVRAADPSGDVGPLPDGKALHVLALGFERLLADLYWIRTVYYVGDERSQEAGWPAAERLAQLVTDIDPRFDSVYVLMSSVLSGMRSDPDAAIRLLEKGAAQSSYWRIHFLLGFNYFMEKQDYEKGAAALQRALDLGGPSYLQFLITRLYAHGGEADTAMSFLQARLQHEESPKVREKLRKRLSDLWINRDLGQIDAAIAKFQAAKQRAPKSVAELVEAGLLARAPRDPRGGEYTIEDGRASSAVPYEVLKLRL